MKRIKQAACTFFLLAAASCGPNLEEQDFETLPESKEPVEQLAQLLSGSRSIPGEYIVVFKSGLQQVTEHGVPSIARELAGLHGGQVFHTYEHALKGFAVRMPEARMQALRADPRIAYIEENQLVSIEATQTGATWGLDRVDQRDLPLNSAYNYATTASNVHAYVIDTGVRRTHQEFSGRIGNGFDAVTSGGSANDCHGHGTHVAGTLGGTTFGVAKRTIIHPVRVLDCSGVGSTAGIVAGVDWVRFNHIKPAVANMSLGGGASQAMDDAVNNAVAAGVVFAVAAGNDNSSACNFSPARAAGAITVGSTTNTDARSSFSNFGPCLNIWAPGSNVTSAWSTGDTATNIISGTSMASPHVAGAAALYLSFNPSATPQQVRDALVNNGSLNRVSNAGTGSINRLLYTGFIGGGCGILEQRLGNPGFESGNVTWAASSLIIDNTFNGSAPRSGSWKAWMNGYGQAHTDWLYQQVTIPSTACSALLSFWMNITTAETTTTTAYDRLTVYVLDSAGRVMAILATYSNLNRTSGYVQTRFDLSAYRGQTIYVYFEGIEDASLQTSFFIDDTALTITR